MPRFPAKVIIEKLLMGKHHSMRPISHLVVGEFLQIFFTLVGQQFVLTRSDITLDMRLWSQAVSITNQGSTECLVYQHRACRTLPQTHFIVKDVCHWMHGYRNHWKLKAKKKDEGFSKDSCEMFFWAQHSVVLECNFHDMLQALNHGQNMVCVHNS